MDLPAPKTSTEDVIIYKARICSGEFVEYTCRQGYEDIVLAFGNFLRGFLLQWTTEKQFRQTFMIILSQLKQDSTLTVPVKPFTFYTCRIRTGASSLPAAGPATPPTLPFFRQISIHSVLRYR